MVVLFWVLYEDFEASAVVPVSWVAFDGDDLVFDFGFGEDEDVYFLVSVFLVFSFVFNFDIGDGIVEVVQVR